MDNKNLTLADDNIIKSHIFSDNFGYVKFEDEISPVYKLVNIHIVTNWFHEFETSFNTFADIGFEMYDEYRIINYQPKTNFFIFEKLYDHVHILKVPVFVSIDEQINFIDLLCKLADKKKLNQIIKSIEFNPYVWSILTTMNFDAKNFFDEHVKVLACFFACHHSATDKIIHILNFYGVM